MSKGILYIISGPSGTGKGTICKELSAKRDIYLSVSATSRDMREGEEEGVTYYYKTPEAFRHMAQTGQMLEWAMYGENYYGTPKAPVEENMEKGRDVILEIEPQGAMKVKAARPDAVMIFVIPPSMAVLRKRLVDRGRETPAQIQERIDAAKWEFTQAANYNHIIVNDDLAVCVEDVLAVMDQTKAQRDKVDALLTEAM